MCIYLARKVHSSYISKFKHIFIVNKLLIIDWLDNKFCCCIFLSGISVPKKKHCWHLFINCNKILSNNDSCAWGRRKPISNFLVDLDHKVVFKISPLVHPLFDLINFARQHINRRHLNRGHARRMSLPCPLNFQPLNEKRANTIIIGVEGTQCVQVFVM